MWIDTKPAGHYVVRFMVFACFIPHMFSRLPYNHTPSRFPIQSDGLPYKSADMFFAKSAGQYTAVMQAMISYNQGLHESTSQQVTSGETYVIVTFR